METSAPIQVTETGAPAVRARRDRLRAFQWRLAAFFFPLVSILLLLEVVLWRARETWPVTRVIEYQRQHPGALFMRGLFDQSFYSYKLHQIETRAPKILSLGSSRVMEFREEMFGADGADFFNGGGMIQDLGDLLWFARHLPATPPEVVILGLDLWWFNERLPISGGLESRGHEDAARDWQAHVKSLRRFKSGRLRRSVWRAGSAANDHIGVEARNAGVGFRRDGSMEYNLTVPTNAAGWAFVDRENPPVARRIREGIEQFIPQAGTIQHRLDLLEQALELFREKGVLVAGFFPPFSEESARLMEQSPGHADLWRAVRSQVMGLFNEKHLPFFDASRASTLGLDDRYLIDGMHAAETFQLHVLNRLLEQSELDERFPGLREQNARILADPRTNPWRPAYDSQPAGAHAREPRKEGNPRE